MLKMLVKSVGYEDGLEMMYLSKGGEVSKRRVNVLKVGEVSFRAYCYLRQSKRTFTIDNILALVPVIRKENDVV